MSHSTWKFPFVDVTLPFPVPLFLKTSATIGNDVQFGLINLLPRTHSHIVIMKTRSNIISPPLPLPTCPSSLDATLEATPDLLKAYPN